MRSHLLAQRIILALALAAALAACSSGTPSASSPPSSSSPTSSSPASSGAKAEITKAWETLFSGTSSAATKASLVQNGQSFASIISSVDGSSLAKSASAQVTAVSQTSPTQARVTYNVLEGGKVVVKNLVGQALYQNGMWKASSASFCVVLALESGGKPPSVCIPSSS